MPKKSEDEKDLEKLAKKLLSTPPKPREKRNGKDAATVGHCPMDQPAPSGWNDLANGNTAAVDLLTSEARDSRSP